MLVTFLTQAGDQSAGSRKASRRQNLAQVLSAFGELAQPARPRFEGIVVARPFS